MKILKNPSSVWVNAEYGRVKVIIKPKGSFTLDNPKEDEIVADLLIRFQFLKEITPVETHPAPKTQKEVQQVVKQAKPVKTTRAKASGRKSK